MRVHKDVFRNQPPRCRIREAVAVPERITGFDICVLIVAVVLACALSAAGAEKATAALKPVVTPDEPTTPVFPFFAEITGDDVYYRSGPGTNFYECGKFKKGERVKVISKQFSWYQIVPPANSFSWIAMQYVNPDADNPGFGIVTGDRVRVYAGSNRVPRIPPQHSTSLQGKLNKGDKVKLLGDPVDGHYKVTPPAFAYLWVSTYFAKALPPTAKVDPAEVKPSVKISPPVKTLAPGEIPTVVKFNPADTPVVTAVSPKPAPELVEEKVLPPGSRLEQYQALREKIKAEKAKPLKEQDYKPIKEALNLIANDKEAGNVAKYAKAVLRQVEGYELALAIIEKVQLQNEKLKEKTAAIEEQHAEKMAEVKDRGRFAATGKLEPFTLYGPGNYRIVDDSGKMLCYAKPSGLTEKDLAELIGQKVGIVGTIQPHLPTKKAMVRFSEIVPLK